MASSKKTSETSKTAHVMNLISKHSPAPSAQEPQASAATETSPVTSTAAPTETTASEPPAAPAAAKPPIIVSMTSDAAVSETIKNALEDALEAETAPQTAPPPKESPVETNAETQPEAVESPVRATVPESNDVTSAQAPAQEANAQSSAQETNTAELVPQKLDKSRWDGLSGTTYVNVMQILVEENTEKYMKMFGLCQCPRCVVDVKALALNNLPPKYVVMKEGEMVPRITLYEGRFQTAVTAQVLRACQSVMANPRHDRTT